MSDIITTVENMERRGGQTYVTVQVVGPQNIPKITKKSRARGRAFFAAGPVPTTIDTIADLSAGDINRFTSVSRKPDVVDVDPDIIPDFIPFGEEFIEQRFEALEYNVTVNRHGSTEY